ncbi:MAG: hypothetical protein QXR96_00765 [Candidatus Woesearchaeota archaeon]
MIEIECTARKIGNSIGFIIPKYVVEKEKIKENEKIKIIISKNKDVFDKTFGKLKFNKQTDLIMREIDEELWG